MDLRQYFRKLKETEAALPDEYPLIVSLSTADGGKAGLVSEVPRLVAAKMIIEGRAAIATQEQAETFLEEQINAKSAAAKAELVGRVQVAILTDCNLQSQLSQHTSDGPSATGK